MEKSYFWPVLSRFSKILFWGACTVSFVESSGTKIMTVISYARGREKEVHRNRSLKRLLHIFKCFFFFLHSWCIILAKDLTQARRLFGANIGVNIGHFSSREEAADVSCS